ncbi:MFS transporter [Planococcus rifietoensis]|uniref:MFS transporter n=1 Tax=Planococcus rifietoensis TaxID=200991 RepID=UPI00384A8153
MWKIVLPGIAMIGVTYAFARYSFGLFLPEISSALNLSESQSGLIGSVAYAAYTIALVTAALFIHKQSARHVVLYSGATAFIGMLGMAMSQAFYTLAISAFVAGLGSGWVSPAFSQVVAQSLESRERDKGNTWINTGTSVGVVASGPVALAFAEQWRWGYVLFALLAFLTFWWNARLIDRPKQEPEESTGSQFKLNLLGQARFMIIAAIGIGFSSSIYWTFSRSYLTEAHDFSVTESMVFWIVMGAAGIIGGIAGTIIQRLGLGWSYRLGVMVATASLVTLTISHSAAIFPVGEFIRHLIHFHDRLIHRLGHTPFPGRPFCWRELVVLLARHRAITRLCRGGRLDRRHVLSDCLSVIRSDWLAVYLH